ncbi:MAG TPA: hypothetical protein VND02_08130, partial [Actinomycetota bacterium]|nr:hypothetical protein [Actinomycetota bacterium]
MGLPAGRPSLARILLLAVALACVPAAAAGEPAAPVPAPAGGCGQPEDASARFGYPPSQGPHATRGGGVRARAGAGRVRGRCRGGGRRAAAVAVDGRVVAGKGRTRVVELDRDADVRAAARRLAGRPGVAYAEPDWVRRFGERWRRKEFTSPSGVRCEPAQAPPTSPHGTEVASVIAALDNDSGTTGVAPEA